MYSIPNRCGEGWAADKQADKSIAAKKIREHIIVGIANTPGRMEEYTHVQDTFGGRLLGGKAEQYADFVIREVKPLIDGYYRTLPQRKMTSMMGSSLGGLLSFWFGELYPDVFFRIGALSSTFGWGKGDAKNQTILELTRKSSKRDLMIYIDSGSPRDNYQVTLQMRDILLKKGYKQNKDLFYWLEKGAVHNEKAWRVRLFRPFEYLLK